MCTRVCPCDSDKMSEWLALSESALNAFNRTKDAAPASQSVTKNGDGMTYLISANSANTKTYSKFIDCVENLETLAAANADPNAATEEEDNGKSETALKVISFFEAKYTCSGICNKALFFFTLDMDQGVPESTCLKAINKEISGSMNYLGVTGVIIGLLMFLIWMC